MLPCTTVPERDEHGRLHRVQRSFKARIPKGATDGQRLRLPGKGGKGAGGGPDGDLYLNIALHPHALFRVSGHDLYLDLPLTPWEAALGAAAGDYIGRPKIPPAPPVAPGVYSFSSLPAAGAPNGHYVVPLKLWSKTKWGTVTVELTKLKTGEAAKS